MPKSTTHVIEIETGIGEPAFIPLTTGQELQPISIGKKGMWRIESARVLDVHAFVYFDGTTLFVQSAEDAASASVDGYRVGKAWTELHAPCRIEIGSAILRFRSLEKHPVTATQQSPQPRRRSAAPPPRPPEDEPPPEDPVSFPKPARPFRPGELATGGDDEETATRVAADLSSSVPAAPRPAAGRAVHDETRMEGSGSGRRDRPPLSPLPQRPEEQTVALPSAPVSVVSTPANAFGSVPPAGTPRTHPRGHGSMPPPGHGSMPPPGYGSIPPPAAVPRGLMHGHGSVPPPGGAPRGGHGPGMMHPNMGRLAAPGPGAAPTAMSPGVRPSMPPPMMGSQPPPGMQPHGGAGFGPRQNAMTGPAYPSAPPGRMTAGGGYGSRPNSVADEPEGGLRYYLARYAELSLPKRILLIAAPFCLFASAYLILVDDTLGLRGGEPRPASPTPSAAASRPAADAGSVAAGSNVPLCPPGFVPYTSAGAGGTIPCVPAGTPMPSGASDAAAGTAPGSAGTAATASAATAAAAVVVAGPTDAGSAQAAATPTTLERQAVDFVAAKDYAHAAAVYEQLQAQNPQNRVYAEAARILRAKADAGRP
jgi:hypothetical protein